MSSAVLNPSDARVVQSPSESRSRFGWRPLLHGILFVWSLLAVFRAPAYPFWIAAIFATEAGLVIAAMCALLLIRSPRSILLWSAVLLFLSPLVRAYPIARALPNDLSLAFGNARPRALPDAPAQAAPFRLLTLLAGVSSPAVHEETVTFVTRQGSPLFMDIYNRPSVDPKPAVLVVHGGSWAAGDRKELPALNRYLAARGYLVVSIDYRLAPEAHFPAPVEDVLSAIDFLNKNATSLGFDGQLVLFGRSAGAQIALFTAYAYKNPAVRGVISFYGPADMEFAYSRPGNPWIMDSQQVLRTYLGSDQSQAFLDSSPLLRADASAPPTLLVHGLRDELVWPTHAFHLTERLQELHRPVYFLKLPWATHGADYVFRGPSGQLTTYAVERFLAATLRSARSSQ